jgi:hypothetical protein
MFSHLADERSFSNFYLNKFLTIGDMVMTYNHTIMF